MRNSTTSSLSFLDLPVEVRLMIYEFLPNRTVRTEYAKSIDGAADSFFAISTTTAQMAILATCRKIRNEARGIIRAKAKQLLRGRIYLTQEETVQEGPDPRIETDTRGLRVLCAKKGLIKAIGEWANAIYEGRFGYLDTCITATLGSEIGTFLHLHCYKMQNGSNEEGAAQLRNFIRQAGWMLNHQLFHGFHCAGGQWQTENGIGRPAINLALVQTMPVSYAMRNDVLQCLRNFGYCCDLHNLRVIVNTLSRTKTGEKVEKDFQVNAFGVIKDFHYDTGYSTIEIGIHKYDKKEKNRYGKFWMDGEWL